MLLLAERGKHPTRLKMLIRTVNVFRRKKKTSNVYVRTTNMKAAGRPEGHMLVVLEQMHGQRSCQ